MALRLTAALEGRLGEYMAAERAGILAGSEIAVREETVSVKNDARAEINRAFQGSGRVAGGNRRVANAVRDKYYKNADGSVAGIVYSKFGTRGPGGEFLDYLLPHATGATIKPRHAQRLFISFLSGRRGTVRYTPALDKRIAFIKGEGGKVYVVRKQRNKTVLLGIMVRQVRLPRRLDFDRVTRGREDKLAQRLVVALEGASVDRVQTSRGSRFALRSGSGEFLGRI